MFADRMVTEANVIIAFLLHETNLKKNSKTWLSCKKTSFKNQYRGSILMKEKIYELCCSRLHSIKQKTESLVNHLKRHQDSIIKAGVAPLFCLFCMYQFRMYNSRSSPKLLNQQNTAVTATMNRSCDLAKSHSKMSTDVVEVTISGNKVINVYNLTYGVSFNATPKKDITGDSQISNHEMNVDECHSKMSIRLKEVTTEYLQLQSDQMDPSLIDNVATAGQDVQNQALDVSVHKGPQAKELLHIIFNHLNRFYYVGTHSIETDPSRVELKDPVGYHRPTVVRLGSLQKSVCLPGIPKTQMIKSGNTALEILNILVPKSSPIKPLTTCLVKSITIGHFKTTSITRRGKSLPSNMMYWKTLVAQQQHRLMVLQVRNIFRYAHPRNVLIVMHHLRHPNQPLLNPRMLNVRQIYAVALMVRANFIPPFLFGHVPPFINTDGRLLVHHDQIKSVSEGVLFECNLLHPLFVMLKREDVWTKYISTRFEIALRRTKTHTMSTNMIEFQIHGSGIGFEALNIVASKTPLIKRVSPVITFVTSFVQEFFPIEVFLQAGNQHSNTINFNVLQEYLRTNEMFDRNLDVNDRMQHHLVTYFRPINRRNRFNNLAEIHHRTFYSVKWMIRYDFDLFGKLNKMTSPKER